MRSIRRFYKVSKRREMDMSTVAGAFVLRLTESGTIVHARLAYDGVAAMPMRARATEEALIGKRWRRETCEEVLSTLEAEFAPISERARQCDLSTGVDQDPAAQVFYG